MQVKYSEPGLHDTWSWVKSPNRYGEDEILLFGVRLGVEVAEHELPCKGDGELEE